MRHGLLVLATPSRQCLSAPAQAFADAGYVTLAECYPDTFIAGISSFSADAAHGPGEAGDIETDCTFRLARDPPGFHAGAGDEIDEFVSERIRSDARAISQVGVRPEQLRHAPAAVERIASKSAPVERVAFGREFHHRLANAEDAPTARKVRCHQSTSS